MPEQMTTGRDGEAEWGYRSRCLDLLGDKELAILLASKSCNWGYFLV
jgi:hypothetical protein